MTRVLSAGWEDLWLHPDMYWHEGTVYISHPSGGVQGDGCLLMRVGANLAPAADINYVGRLHYEIASSTEIWFNLDWKVNWYREFAGEHPEYIAKAYARIEWDNADNTDRGYIEFRGVGGDLRWNWGTGSGTVAWPITAKTWYNILGHVKVDAAGNEVIEIWIDDVKVVDVDQDLFPAFSDMDRFSFYGEVEGTVVGPHDYRLEIFVDNLIVNNSEGSADNASPGRLYMTQHAIAGDGASSDFSRGGVDHGANYLQVDEIPADGDWTWDDKEEASNIGTEFVLTDSDGDVDLYTLPSLATPPAGESMVIRAVHVRIRAQLSDFDAAKGLDPLARIDGVNHSGSTLVPGTVWSPGEHRWRESPSSGRPWTNFELRDTELGVESV